MVIQLEQTDEQAEPHGRPYREGVDKIQILGIAAHVVADVLVLVDPVGVEFDSLGAASGEVVGIQVQTAGHKQAQVKIEAHATLQGNGTAEAQTHVRLHGIQTELKVCDDGTLVVGGDFEEGRVGPVRLGNAVSTAGIQGFTFCVEQRAHREPGTDGKVERGRLGRENVEQELCMGVLGSALQVQFVDIHGPALVTHREIRIDGTELVALYDNGAQNGVQGAVPGAELDIAADGHGKVYADAIEKVHVDTKGHVVEYLLVLRERLRHGYNRGGK